LDQPICGVHIFAEKLPPLSWLNPPTMFPESSLRQAMVLRMVGSVEV
jgi:hypothetical protein